MNRNELYSDGCITVTDLEGRISFARGTGRHFAKIISMLALLIDYHGRIH